MPNPLPPAPPPPPPPQQNRERPTNPAPTTPLPTSQAGGAGPVQKTLTSAPVRAPASSAPPQGGPTPPASAVHTTSRSNVGDPARSIVQNAAETTAATPAQERAAAEAEARMAQLLELGGGLANSVCALYGDSGSGKTSQTGEAIEYAWETYHRISRIYHYDQGGFGAKILKLAKLGIAQVWRPRNHIEAFETCELCSLGYWPETILDSETGYADPYVALVPPLIRRYTVFCPNGHEVVTVSTKTQAERVQQGCPECRTITTLANWSKIEEQVVVPASARHVGLYGHDSVTAMADWVMQDMATRSASGDTGLMTGEKNQLRHTTAAVVSGSMTFGGNTIAHYGFAQNRVASWLGNMGRVPRMVVPPIATFLESKGSDEANLNVYGPSIPGTARTAAVPSWVGNCFHQAMVAVGDQMRFRIWTRTHSSPLEGNVPHLAKHRGEPGDLPLYLEDKADQPPFSTASLKHIFRTLDQKLAESLRLAAARYQDAPAFVPFAADEGDEIVSTAVVSTQAFQPRATTPLPPGVAGMVPTSQVAAVGGVPMPPMPPMLPAGLAPAAPAALVAAPPLPAAAAAPMPPGAQPAVSPAAAQGLHLVPPPVEQPVAPASAPASTAAAPAVPPSTRAVSSRSKRPPIPNATSTPSTAADSTK